MCGIVGIVDPKSPDTIRKMADRILHRGPDEDGYFADEHLALGMRRLSIIDLKNGSQPIYSSDGRYIFVFNGEIYNYRELKSDLPNYEFKTESDTEVMLALYELYGTKSFARLRGMFAGAIYDTRDKKLVLVRDFFGIKPLYYLAKANNFAFASEIKSLLVMPDFKLEVNDEAVYNYLSFQYNPLDETFFKGVYKLPPGHFMTLDVLSGKVEISTYWDFRFDQNDSLDESKTAVKVVEAMRDSVEHHMIADVPVGSFLSGGIDSSIIATLMQRRRQQESASRPQSASGKIKTFTVTFGSTSEGLEAKETAEPLGTLHTEITVGVKEYFEALPKVIWHFDEPVGDPSALGLYFLAQEARKSVKVVLSGEGADELFGGYNIYLAPLSSAKLAWVPKSILSFFLGLPFEYFGKNYLRRVSMQLEDWYFGQKYFNESIFRRDEIQRIWKGGPQEFSSLSALYSNTRNLSQSTAMQYVDINTWLVGDILAKADKMTMAHSLELRVPFLDREVADLARTLPDRFKWRGGVTKHLLREAFKNILPESTRMRRKLGFPTPLRDWLRNPDLEIYKTIRDNSYIKEHLDLHYIESLIHGHTNNSKDNSRKLYLIGILAIWYNTFVTK